MAKILLDYVFPISVVASIPEVSTAFLKQVLVVVKPNEGGEDGTITECVLMADVTAITDNTNAQQLFNAGMSKVFVLCTEDLDLAESIVAGLGDFWTVLISDDFDAEDLIGIGGTPAVPEVPAVKASLKIEDVLYTAVLAGEDGNAITITYTDTEVTPIATVVVTDTDIVIGIQAGVTTADTIADAVNADNDANDLVVALCDVGDETDPQAAHVEAPLEDGADLVPEVPAVPGDGAFDVGAFDGVVGMSFDDADDAQGFGADENRCAFFTSVTNGGKNMFYAFGKLLSNLTNWGNQQYISMPVSDDVDTLGDANSLFDDKVSFVIHDEEFGNRLALFSAGGKAIAAPYIGKNLRVDLQGRTVSWIASNQPTYSLKNAALLEQRLQEDIINVRYINTQWIDAGVISVTLLQDNFVATGAIDIAEPKALWRMFGEMRSTL